MNSCNQGGFVAIRFLNEVAYMQKNATFIFNNSQGSLGLLKNPMHHLRIKHINIQFHFVREHISSSEVLFDYYSMKEMATNIFTKEIPID
jgi:hypothetical protein